MWFFLIMHKCFQYIEHCRIIVLNNCLYIHAFHLYTLFCAYTACTYISHWSLAYYTTILVNCNCLDFVCVSDLAKYLHQLFSLNFVTLLIFWFLSLYITHNWFVIRCFVYWKCLLYNMTGKLNNKYLMVHVLKLTVVI